MQQSLIDWLSFTIPAEWSENMPEYQAADWAWRYIDEALPLSLWTSIFELFEMAQTSGRPPYRVAYRSTPAGLSVYLNPSLPHILLEFTGQGVEALRDNELLTDLLAAIHQRVTRIDFAVDWLTEVRPTAFIAAGYSGRFSSTGIVTSDTGETVYVGSKKSDMYARVYRYSPPHPRSAFLRCEMVLRKQRAKEAARMAAEGDLKGVIASVGASFKWSHGLWSLEAEEPIPNYRPERPLAKTERWLIAQAGPAFRKLIAAGVITEPNRWLETYFLEETS